MGKFVDMAILWVLHFLQTPEGQAILAQAEVEMQADIVADAIEDAGGPTTPPVTQPVTPSQPNVSAPSPNILFNPKKRSSATNEQI